MLSLNHTTRLVWLRYPYESELHRGQLMCRVPSTYVESWEERISYQVQIAQRSSRVQTGWVYNSIILFFFNFSLLLTFLPNFFPNNTTVWFYFTGTFNCECETVLIYELSLIILPSSSTQGNKILITTLQGTVKQTLDSDGRPVMIYLNQNYLVAATMIGILQIWDVSRRSVEL